MDGPQENVNVRFHALPSYKQKCPAIICDNLERVLIYSIAHIKCIHLPDELYTPALPSYNTSPGNLNSYKYLATIIWVLVSWSSSDGWHTHNAFIILSFRQAQNQTPWTKSGFRNPSKNLWRLENMDQIIDIKKTLFQSCIRVSNRLYNVPMFLVPMCQSVTGEYRSKGGQ